MPRPRRYNALPEETDRDAEQTVDTPAPVRAWRPAGHAARVACPVAAGSPGASGGRVAGGRAAASPVGHGPGWATHGPAVAGRPGLGHAAGRLLGTHGAGLAGAGAHGRGGVWGGRARGGGGARGPPDPRASGPGRAGCAWGTKSERPRGVPGAPP